MYVRAPTGASRRSRPPAPVADGREARALGGNQRVHRACRRRAVRRNPVSAQSVAQSICGWLPRGPFTRSQVRCYFEHDNWALWEPCKELPAPASLMHQGLGSPPLHPALSAPVPHPAPKPLPADSCFLAEWLVTAYSLSAVRRRPRTSVSDSVRKCLSKFGRRRWNLNLILLSRSEIGIKSPREIGTKA